jgi:hypothetical protein
MTEDEDDGCFYRFTPDVYPDLSSGLLEIAIGEGAGPVSWQEVPNPHGGGLDPTRRQVGAAAHFRGGEGIWYDSGKAYFTTEGDNRIWLFDAAASTIEVLYDPSVVGSGAPLNGVDNVTVSQWGDIYVCEDDSDHDICLITPSFEISRFLRLDPAVHIADNELVGVVFSPDGTRMHFGAQRSFAVAGDPYSGGVVYEVVGPFRQLDGESNTPSTALNLLVDIPRHTRIERFLRRGLTIGVDTDAPAGVEARLRVRRPGRRTGLRTIASVKPGVALQGATKLLLEPTRDAKRLLRGRGNVEAELKVVATGVSERAVARRRVGLRRAPHDR